MIQRAIDDVAQTVQRMRAFYTPRGLERTLSPTALNEVLAQVIDLTRVRWQNMAQERGVVVRVDSDFAPDLPNVLGAESEVRDAMTNLMLNAVDALPDGGVITLRSRHNVRDSEVVIEIEDNGVGMSETVRSRCLEPFFTTKGERGTGLGLTMVFGMMQRHGGELEIDSEPGRGSLVRLVFPFTASLSKTWNISWTHSPSSPAVMRRCGEMWTKTAILTDFQRLSMGNGKGKDAGGEAALIHHSPSL